MSMGGCSGIGLLFVVPTNIIQAMGNGDLLAIVFFSVLFGIGISVIGEKNKPVMEGDVLGD